MHPNLESLLKRLTLDNPKDKIALEEYAEAITHLADKELAIEFNNKDANHAKMVMVTLFNKAEKEIKIFARSFSGEISDDESYLDSLKEAIINRNIKVNVILDNDPNPNSKCIALLKELKSGGQNNITGLKLNDTIKREIMDRNSIDQLLNFTVVDDNMFRFENDIDHFKAICSFDDAETAETLKNNFKKLSIDGIPLF